LYDIQQKLLSFVLIAVLFGFIFAFLPTSEAHILVVGDSNNYQEASKLGSDLQAKGYDVLGLYKENATAKNILKGMYGADAVIYAGHGGYMSGKYDESKNNTPASPPFALVGQDDFIWGVGDQMKEGSSGTPFTAPFKQNIPVILLHACFSTGWVGNNEVSNPTETIYNFARMFNGAGANYYATGWNGAEIVYDFLNGATSFADANNKNYEKITTSAVYNGTQVWRNSHGTAAFVGNWSGKFPTAAETTPYDDVAAEKWYNGILTGTPSNPPSNPPSSSAKPDLVVTNAYKSGNYLYVTLKNQGTANSGAFYTRASYGNNYRNIYIYGLKSGESKNYGVYFPYVHGTVNADYYNKIVELDENNNLKSF
jgi:hypothetical protein